MDSEIKRDGRLMDLIDDDWRRDKLPCDDIKVPKAELPNPESDVVKSNEPAKEQEKKWDELALERVRPKPPATPTQ